MSNIVITTAEGLSWDTLYLLEMASKLEGITVEEFIIKHSVIAAEELVGDDIQQQLSL